MRQFVIFCSIVSIWIFGWATHAFGFLSAFFLTWITALPIFIACRMLKSDRTFKRREFVYIGIASMLAMSATGIVINTWINRGMDRDVIRSREFNAFERYVESTPEFSHVDVSHAPPGLQALYLRGSVANKRSYERLMHAAKSTLRYGGYYDEVEFPGKRKRDSDLTTLPKNTDEQSVARGVAGRAI